MEGAIGLRQRLVVGDHLFEAEILELAFDHFDERVAGHGVELDAFVEQDLDLRVVGAVPGELSAQDVRGCFCRRGGFFRGFSSVLVRKT